MLTGKGVRLDVTATAAVRTHSPPSPVLSNQEETPSLGRKRELCPTLWLSRGPPKGLVSASPIRERSGNQRTLDARLQLKTKEIWAACCYSRGTWSAVRANTAECPPPRGRKRRMEHLTDSLAFQGNLHEEWSLFCRISGTDGAWIL